MLCLLFYLFCYFATDLSLILPENRMTSKICLGQFGTITLFRMAVMVVFSVLQCALNHLQYALNQIFMMAGIKCFSLFAEICKDK